MTKAEFLVAYERQLVQSYRWADDKEKLGRFMHSVRDTLHTPKATWNHDGEAVTAAWRSIGGKGKPTLKALRALI